MKKKDGKNEEKILGVHLKATVSKGEKLVSNNGRLAMVSHHCLHLYITSISIHCKDRKKNTTIFFQTTQTITAKKTGQRQKTLPKTPTKITAFLIYIVLMNNLRG